MAEEPEAPEEITPDTPEEGGSPSDETPAEEVTDTTDWQKRYTDAQSWGTQQAQEAAQYRQIIDLARQGDQEALAYLGYATEDDGEEPDPDEQIRREVEELRSWRDEQTQTQQQAQQEQAEVEWLGQQIGDLQGKENREFSEQEIAYLDHVASANRNPQTGEPNITAAYEQLKALESDVRQRYVDSKRAPRVPGGGAGDEKLDTTDTAAAMEQIMAAQMTD